MRTLAWIGFGCAEGLIVLVMLLLQAFASTPSAPGLNFAVWLILEAIGVTCLILVACWFGKVLGRS